MVGASRARRRTPGRCFVWQPDHGSEVLVWTVVPGLDFGDRMREVQNGDPLMILYHQPRLAEEGKTGCGTSYSQAVQVTDGERARTSSALEVLRRAAGHGRR